MVFFIGFIIFVVVGLYLILGVFVPNSIKVERELIYEKIYKEGYKDAFNDFSNTLNYHHKKRKGEGGSNSQFKFDLNNLSCLNCLSKKITLVNLVEEQLIIFKCIECNQIVLIKGNNRNSFSNTDHHKQRGR